MEKWSPSFIKEPLDEDNTTFFDIEIEVHICGIFQQKGNQIEKYKKHVVEAKQWLFGSEYL